MSSQKELEEEDSNLSTDKGFQRCETLENNRLTESEKKAPVIKKKCIVMGTGHSTWNIKQSKKKFIDINKIKMNPKLSNKNLVVIQNSPQKNYINDESDFYEEVIVRETRKIDDNIESGALDQNLNQNRLQTISVSKFGTKRS